MKKFILAAAAVAFGLTMSVAGAAEATGAKTLAEIHGKNWPDASGWVKKDTCMGCHGSYADLAKTTAKLEPNPHFSHLGEVNCQECHIGAKAKPELMCNTCHNFTLREKAAKK